MTETVVSEVVSDVLSEVRGQVGFITLNRPRALNALSLGMVRDLMAILLAWLGAGERPAPAVLMGGTLVIAALVFNELLGWKEQGT